MKHLIKNIVIVGSRAAGPAAAAKARRENPDARITIIDSGLYVSTGTCEIPYLISGEVGSSEDLRFFSPEEFSQKYAVELLLETKVISLLPRQRILKVEKNGAVFELSYHRLILATGAKHKIHPDLPADSTNVFYVRSIEEIENLLNKATINGKKWCVVGASYSGIEFAEVLKKNGNEVLLIEKESLPAPGFITEIRELIKESLLSEGIDFFGNVAEIKVYSEAGYVKKIKFDGRLKEIDFVIVAIGIEPNSAIAKNAGLEMGIRGGIKVDNRMRTSDQYIFAAGDCAEIKEKITGRMVWLPSAKIARDGGHVAGANAAGGNEFFSPVIRNISLRVFNNFATATGLCTTRMDNLRIRFRSVAATSNAIVDVMPGTHKVFGKIFIADDGKILGAGFFGGAEVSGYCDIIALAIKAGLKISDLKECNFNYTPTLSPFKNLLEMLAYKAVQK
ncbi:FAD-dependent oxidoreductase [Ignavibacteriales bacterium]